jgi:hypothetical protein
MNSRFTPIDTRHFGATSSLVRLDGITSMSLWNEIGVALHHSPGEGCGGSS